MYTHFLFFSCLRFIKSLYFFKITFLKYTAHFIGEYSAPYIPLFITLQLINSENLKNQSFLRT